MRHDISFDRLQTAILDLAYEKLSASDRWSIWSNLISVSQIVLLLHEW